MRKNYLDNIRWFTILLVVIFHVFFYFNNIGITPVFDGLPEYHSGDNFRIETIFEYMVYPWFMVLLFVVAGMSSFYALKEKDSKIFLKSRAKKLLVPSLLGVACFGWISGFIVVNQSMRNSGVSSLDKVPILIKFLIYTFSGTGALWFCQVLFIATIFLLLIRKIDISINKEEKFFIKGKIFSSIILIVFYFFLWGASKILNVPVVTSYRFGIYIFSFIAGYYLFSQDLIVKILKKLRFVTTFFAILSGLYFINKAYGTYYADIKLLCSWYTNLFVYFSLLSVLGIFSTYFDTTNSFTRFCNNESFSIYVLHISVLVVVLKLLDLSHFSIWMKYSISFVVCILVTLILGIVIKKIPVLRYIILGVSQKKEKTWRKR